MTSFRRTPTNLLFLVFGLVLLAGCSDESTAPFPCRENPAGFGRIRGTVTSGGIPAAAELHIHAVEMQAPGVPSLTAQCDSSGRFEVVLPQGQYRLGVYCPSQRRDFWYKQGSFMFKEEHGDVLTVADSTISLDLGLGDLELSLVFPEGTAHPNTSCRAKHMESGNFLEIYGNTSFSFSLIPPGTYTLQLSTSIAPNTFWVPATVDQDRAEHLVVVPGRQTVVNDTLPVPGRVRGQIAGAWQQMEVDPPFIGLILPSGGSLSSGRAATDGNFDLPLLGTGHFKALFGFSGQLMDRWFGGDSLASATTFEMDNSGVADLGTIREAGILCHLIGRPEWGTNGTSVVMLRIGTASIRVGGRGDWLPIPALVPGSYKLFLQSLSAAPWRPQWYDRARSEEEALPVDISSEGQLVQVEVQLEEGATITGRVLAADGASYSLPVFLQQTCGGADWNPRDIWTAEDGTFTFPGLPPGCFHLGARKGGVTTWYPGTANPDSATAIQVENTEEITGIKWRLRP